MKRVKDYGLNPSNKKKPKSTVNPDSYLGQHPTWTFHRCDISHDKWSIRKCESIYEKIIDKLISYEGQTWMEIISATGGKSSGTRSHFINVSDLEKEAQKRIDQLHLHIDQVLSLRLDARTRLFGVMDNGTMDILWYDPDHEICKSSKKHS